MGATASKRLKSRSEMVGFLCGTLGLGRRAPSLMLVRGEAA